MTLSELPDAFDGETHCEACNAFCLSLDDWGACSDRCRRALAQEVRAEYEADADREALYDSVLP